MFYESLRCGVVISQSNTSFLTKENTHPSSDTLAMSVSSIPNTVFFPLFCFPFQDFGESRFPSSGQNLYPVKKFSVFPNRVLYFGQIPVPENTLQGFKSLCYHTHVKQVSKDLIWPSILNVLPGNCTSRHSSIPPLQNPSTMMRYFWYPDQCS